MNKAILRISLIACCLILLVIVPGVSRQSFAPVDVATVLSNGENPAVILDEGNRRHGHFRMMDRVWWNSFIHLRPLQSLPELTPSSARELVESALSRGEGSELTGENGVFDTRLGSVYWMEAITNHGQGKAVYYLWDDIENGRRIIADTNIDLSLGTNSSLLMLQRGIIFSIGPAIPDSNNALLNRTTNLDELDITIFHPENTVVRAFPLPSATNPDYPPSQWNTVWILPLEVNRRYDLRWGTHIPENGEDLVHILLPDSLVEIQGQPRTVITINDLQLMERTEGQWIGTATVLLDQESLVSETRWKFAVARWQSGHLQFATLLACEEYDNWRGIPVDGSVTDEMVSGQMQRWMYYIDNAPSWR